MQLLATDREPAAAARRQSRRFVDLGQLQQAAVEAAGGRLAAGGAATCTWSMLVITP